MSEDQKPIGDEPVRTEGKKKRKKQRRKLTKREVKFLEARQLGATLQQASTIAGYSPFKQQGHRVERQIAEKAPEIFDRVGVTMERLGRKVNQLLDAKRMQYFTGIVMETREMEALDIQAKAVDFGLRVHGATQAPPSGDGGHSFTLNLVNASDDDIRAILSAAARAGRAIGPGPQGGMVSQEPIDVAAGG